MSSFLRVVLQSEACAQSYQSDPEAFSSYAQSLLPSLLGRSSLIALQKVALPFGDYDQGCDITSKSLKKYFHVLFTLSGA